MTIPPHLPFAAACEENKAPILAVLAQELNDASSVLEIGSGTGQHAVYFARELPHLSWQPTDVAEHLSGIRGWIEHTGVTNVRPPLALDVGDPTWPVESAEHIYSSNAVHIMSWIHVIALFGGLMGVAQAGAKLILYGPFNYGGEFTSDSNRQFDAMLRQRDPASGIRNFEDLDELANAAGFVFLRDHAMPANNRILVWQKPQ